MVMHYQAYQILAWTLTLLILTLGCHNFNFENIILWHITFKYIKLDSKETTLLGKMIVFNPKYVPKYTLGCQNKDSNNMTLKYTEF